MLVSMFDDVSKLLNIQKTEKLDRYLKYANHVNKTVETKFHVFKNQF